MIVVAENNHKPLVSVLMTAYNREKYIGEAIESVIASSYTNWELIITDDCSGDNTLNIASEYAKKDSRIQVYKNEKNLGDYSNRNRAASYAKGKYLKYLDADDLIYKYSLEIMCSYMEKYRDACFGLSFNVIDDEKPYPQRLLPGEIIRSEFLKISYLGVGPSASIIKKETFDNLKGFSGKQYIGDTELWYKLASEFPMVIMNPSLVWWRQHPEQQMQSELKKPQILIDRLHLAIHYLEHSKHFFSVEEYKYALKRKKQHYARMVLSILFKRKDFRTFFYLFKNSKLGFADWFSGLSRYYT